VSGLGWGRDSALCERVTVVPAALLLKPQFIEAFRAIITEILRIGGRGAGSQATQPQSTRPSSIIRIRGIPLSASSASGEHRNPSRGLSRAVKVLNLEGS